MRDLFFIDLKALASAAAAILVCTAPAFAGSDDFTILDAAYSTVIEIDGEVVNSQTADEISPSAEVLFGEQGDPLFAAALYQTLEAGRDIRVLAVASIGVDNTTESTVSAHVEVVFTIELASSGSFLVFPRTRLFNTVVGNATGAARFEIAGDQGTIFSVPTAPNGRPFFLDRYIYAPAGVYTISYTADAAYTPGADPAGRSEAFLGSDYEVWFSPGFIVCGDADLGFPQGVLDLADITAFVALFGQSQTVDFNFDGVYDLADIVLFVSSFNAGCP